MTISVTFAQLQSTQSDVQGTAGKLETELDGMKTLIAKLAGSYEGEASESWQRVQREWESATSELRQIIAATQQALGSAAENYQAAEKKNAGMWG
ncbi:WXG100 family type VII secretion target [Streptomyces sp. NBC_00249]|uniref:WXG100 family type VII secretion target n=1 Tax=Streptomyces sp. NBC_00249 TaxID=2975690 RepID=UPI00225841A8|nr:WXG100 family type VII secretion target [Streptomyces sp. NBC_00249]MCX5199858.1 WXG100 family type VII secretion target [Streptomyces sp. NBC_00249]